MKKHYTLSPIILAVFLFHFVAVAADAQLVQVRPGYVRAPFVRVQRNPDGSSYVRAPFVRVATPQYQTGEGGLDQTGDDGSAPTPLEVNATQAQNLTFMDWPTLRSALLDSARGLENDLSQTAAGESWRARLHPGLIRDLVVANVDGPPSPYVRTQLAEIMRAFDVASQRSPNSAITGLTGFRNVHAALAEFMMPSAERAYWQLIGRARQLDYALVNVNHSAEWREHLALPDYFTAAATGDPATAMVAPDNDQLTDLVEAYDCFEQVRRDNRYAMISSLQAFQQTHRQQAAYLKLFDVLPPPATPVVPAGERIPAPGPLK